MKVSVMSVPSDPDLYAGIKASWDAAAARYDREPSHRADSQRELLAWRRVLGATFERLGGDGQIRVVDVGTGTGSMAILLAGMGYQVTAVDIAPRMLAQAREKARRLGREITLVEARADALPLPDESVDAVFSRHLFWTLPKPRAALREWARVVRPGGMIAIADGWWSPPGRQWQLRRSAGRALRRLLEPGYDAAQPDYSGFGDRLPLAGGVSPYSIRYYLDSADLVRIRVRDLRSVRRAELRSTPPWRWIDRSPYTWLATAFRPD